MAYAIGRQAAMLLGVVAVVVVVRVRKLGNFSSLSEPVARSREKNLAVRELVREAGKRSEFHWKVEGGDGERLGMGCTRRQRPSPLRRRRGAGGEVVPTRGRG